MDLFIVRDGQQKGPYSRADIDSMLDTGAASINDLAWHAELPTWLPLHKVLNVDPLASSAYRPPLTPTTVAPEVSQYFYIPKARLIVMSLLTFGLYDCYWMYANWRYLKRRHNLNIYPFWRAVFTYFFVYSLLKTIRDDPQGNRWSQARYAAGPLAAGWILLMIMGNVLGRADDAVMNLVGIIISAPTFLLLLPVQTHINSVNEALPEKPAYQGWSVGQIVFLVFGILMWILVPLGMVAAFTNWPPEDF